MQRSAARKSQSATKTESGTDVHQANNNNNNTSNQQLLPAFPLAPDSHRRACPSSSATAAPLRERQRPQHPSFSPTSAFDSQAGANGCSPVDLELLALLARRLCIVRRVRVLQLERRHPARTTTTRRVISTQRTGEDACTYLNCTPPPNKHLHGLGSPGSKCRVTSNSRSAQVQDASLRCEGVPAVDDDRRGRRRMEERSVLASRWRTSTKNLAK